MADNSLSMQELARMALLSPRQRELVQTDIDHIEGALYGRSMHDASEVLGGTRLAGSLAPIPVPEPELLREHLARDRETLARGTGPELSGLQKDRMWKKVKEEVAKYREGLLADSQMQQATAANVEQFMRHEETNKERAFGIRNAMMLLDPTNEALSLEVWRPQDPIRVDWKAYFERFDAIQWSDATERTIAERELDEDTYNAYLRLRAAGMKTQKLIERRLNISRAVFEACEARLKAESAELIAGSAPVEEENEEEEKDNGDYSEEYSIYGEQIITYLLKHKTGLMPALAVDLGLDRRKASKTLNKLRLMNIVERTQDGWELVNPQEESPQEET